MVLSLLAAVALAAPSLTVRRDCDAAGGLPTTKEPLTVAYASEDGALSGQLRLSTLEATTARTSFSILLAGRLADTRTLELVAHAADGAALGRVLVDVDLTTGEVLSAEGAGLSVERVVASRVEEDRFDVGVTLHDKVAVNAALVTLTDHTGDGAVVEGDAFEQAVALAALTTAGRDLVGRYTFDDAHGIDSSRQTWSGSVAVDAAWDGARLAFTADAGRCLPDGVEAPTDGTLEWAEALVLHGSSRAPKWKSVTLGLREAETETWRWPFSARVDGTPQYLLVSMDALDGAVAPRAGEVYVKVPARETLSAASGFTVVPAAEATLWVTVHPYGAPKEPLTTFAVTRTADGVTIDATSWLGSRDGLAIYDTSSDTWAYADGPGRGGRGGSARFDGETWALSTVTLSGPEQVDWDGSLSVEVSGDAVWDDLAVTATLGGGETVTFAFTEIQSVYEGAFLFDEDPSGGTYRWDCVGCGDDFATFELQANLGTGTRTSSSQASCKAELL